MFVGYFIDLPVDAVFADGAKQRVTDGIRIIRLSAVYGPPLLFVLIEEHRWIGIA